MGVAIFAASLNSQSFAGNSCDLSDVDEKSAEDFVYHYYDRLSGGMNRDQLRIFLSSEQNELIDQSISKLATDLKHNYATESQRFLDSMDTEASCESLDLTSSRVWGLNQRFAVLSYDVLPTCTDWKNNSGRTLTLRYSKSMCQWVIVDIKNKVKY